MPSPACIRSWTRKCIPARRFSCVFASYATPCVACCACSNAPTTTPTTATRMAIDTINSINENPFSRFIPLLLGTLECRNICLELVLALELSTRVIDRYQHIANVAERFTREIGDGDRASEIRQWYEDIVRSPQLSVRPWGNDIRRRGSSVIDRADKSVGSRLQQRNRSG